MIRKLGFMLCVLPATMWATPILIDQGVVLIGGPVQNTVITDSDVRDKKSLDGQNIPLATQIKMEIISQKAVEEKMPIDDTAADKYLANIQKSNDLSHEELNDIGFQLGRTFSELRKLLNLQYVYDFFLHHKFRVHLVPTDAQVEEYCLQHPEYEEGWFKIVIASFDFDDENEEDVTKKVNDIFATKQDTGISWSAPIKIKSNDIARDKKFITLMDVGSIHINKLDGSYDLYKLVDKQDDRKKDLSEVKASVIDALNRKMFAEKLQKYESQMMDSVSIINLVD